ncbi:RIP metalloprotease RseP [Methyloterricola oryzae]|uniref:RIP metalloprotease RseP n=1 Tax=Methyloterricola oryzae TaxID=1495050 RepID=UPI0005EAD588|nr:RIP metalloprotease RseP [Methyloterricola oryzae]
MHTLFYFLLALGVLISFHEYGHFIAARKLGVKVLRFSLGFGRTLWRYQKAPDQTEFVIGVLPLGGYVKMVDEREEVVDPADLPYAFNRQSLLKRSIIVAAGPVFNFLLAILLYWAVFMIGETGTKPVLGPVPPQTLAADAGFTEGDEIVQVGDTETPTWNLAMNAFLEAMLIDEKVRFMVKDRDGRSIQRELRVPSELAEQPEKLYEQLGMKPWQPLLEPVVERVEPGSPAEAAGLRGGDRLVSVDGTVIDTWQQWVEHVRAHPGEPLRLAIERDGVTVNLSITPTGIDSPQGKVGRIGAMVKVPEGVMDAMKAEYKLDALPALGAAFLRTGEYSVMTLKMMGRMVIGEAAIENLSGPISIAQYAGQSARMGLVQFFKFLAIVSISLAVLNLLPIPVLDGGHLLFYLIEALKGSPLSENVQAFCQQVGIFLLLSLMALAFFLDIERLLS